MSWGTCNSGSNNIHFGFPPLMADGRNYADWQPGAAVNEEIRKDAGIKTNWEYRQYLTKNADQIMRTNQLAACNQCCACPARYGADRPATGTPFLYSSCTETAKPFGYENSDLKDAYLSSYQLNCRLTAPSLTQDQYLTRGYPNAN